MRIKAVVVLVIVFIIGIVAFLTVKPWADKTRDNDPKEQVAETISAEAGEEKNAAAPAANKTTPEDREFNYRPDEPENGQLRGVVEVGARGFNSFVVNLDNQNRWKMVSKDFGESLAYEGLATTHNIRLGLDNYLSSMFDFGVNSLNMHFVISSGALKEPKITTISRELKRMGYVVNTVTPHQEATYDFQAIMPSSFADSSFMIDIGSGNTKVAWKEGDSIRSLELPGSRYYEKGIPDEDVSAQVHRSIRNVPEGNRKTCFVTGGVPSMMAGTHRKGEERYTVLRRATTYTATDKRMACGLNIYKAIEDATGTDIFVFDWDANFTIGFLLNLPK